MSSPSICGQLADALQDGGWRAKARPSQLPPAGDWWAIWLILTGRGWGKTLDRRELDYRAGSREYLSLGADWRHRQRLSRHND